MLQATRAGMLSNRYEITRDGASLCTWRPTPFLGGGEFELDGRRYEVARGGWTGRRYRLRDDTGALVALADGVGRMAWTLESGGETFTFERRSPIRRDQLLVRDGEPVGSVRRTSAWWGEAAADLADLTPLLQVFVLVSLLSVWDED